MSGAYNNLLDVFSPRAGLWDLAAYVVLARLVLGLKPSAMRSALFTALGLLLLTHWFWDQRAGLVISVLIIFVVVHWLLLRRPRESRFAIALPIAFPVLALAAGDALGARAIVGFSYLSFRLAHAGYEVAVGDARSPRLLDYLAHCAFPPTLFVGPISPLSRFQSSYGQAYEQRTSAPLLRCLFRMLVGLVKVRFIAVLCRQLTFSVLWADGHAHGPEDFAVSAFATLAWLYFNFSGFCDIVIAIAALIGIEVTENFDSPFVSRNLREFWNRWHITLGDVARAIVFTPLSGTLGRALGERRVDFAVCISILATFVAIGLWHGLTLSFLLFGIAHGIGLIAVHLYDRWLKRRWGAKRRRAYLANPWVRLAACALTLSYASATMFFFDNDTSGLNRCISEFRLTPRPWQ